MNPSSQNEDGLSPVYNAHSETIPPFGLMKPTGDFDDKGRAGMTRPDGDSLSGLWVNSEISIAPGSGGGGYQSLKSTVAYDKTDGTPIAGEERGSQDGSWFARKGRFGFKCIAAQNGVMNSVRSGPTYIPDTLADKYTADPPTGVTVSWSGIDWWSLPTTLSAGLVNTSTIVKVPANTSGRLQGVFTCAMSGIFGIAPDTTGPPPTFPQFGQIFGWIQASVWECDSSGNLISMVTDGAGVPSPVSPVVLSWQCNFISFDPAGLAFPTFFGGGNLVNPPNDVGFNGNATPVDLFIPEQLTDKYYTWAIDLNGASGDTTLGSGGYLTGCGIITGNWGSGFNCLFFKPETVDASGV